jgi:phytoene dehydrogenase-like protein
MKGAKILRQERSSSAIVFYWGINGSFPRLDLHNIFFSKNYKAEFDAIFQHKKIYEDPTVYLNITSKYENDKAPAGKENWFIMVNAPSNYGQDWSGLMQQCRSQVVAKLGRMLKTEIEPLIEVEETLDPISIESHSGAFQGAIYGTSSNSRKNAFLRHPNFSRHIQGLYFVGGTVHPGGGIPLCLKSAKIMSEMVAHNLRYFNH